MNCFVLAHHHSLSKQHHFFICQGINPSPFEDYTHSNALQRLPLVYLLNRHHI
ncbi:hypothetical protein SERLADRAFT_469253 [Serpula lacrymans var. lacrymans S7.9]|uniref:Uncharacterized protein n=1 Tax=Serpula lacrymans var. lacrymans (strain S7.9) TaxID=578457 RepID=F8NZQ7_SERL9|nr:uncharacterized protein SERLADRAFT_469253 [Serpula lacrymans var. lacrymans S7.9]EGO23388.1 hypothetical protein SERLADRAFT_469253 [Serpula lacrymans var. lacrymans S7.9]